MGNYCRLDGSHCSARNHNALNQPDTNFAITFLVFDLGHARSFGDVNEALNKIDIHEPHPH